MGILNIRTITFSIHHRMIFLNDIYFSLIGYNKTYLSLFLLCEPQKVNMFILNNETYTFFTEYKHKKIENN